MDEAAGLAGMIPNPRRINPQASPARYERAKKRVLWLMAHAGYIERSVGGLGSAPPPEVGARAAEDEEPPPRRSRSPASRLTRRPCPTLPLSGIARPVTDPSCDPRHASRLQDGP